MIKTISIKLNSCKTALISSIDNNRVQAEGQWTFDNSNGYIVRNIKDSQGNKRRTYLHRFLLNLERGDQQVVDHINGDQLDNRRENLRIVSIAQNNQNKRRVSKSNSSRFLGVTKRGNKYQARVSACKDKDLKQWTATFEDEIEAAVAVNALKLQRFPFSTVDPILEELLLSNITQSVIIQEALELQKIELSRLN